MAIIQRQVRMVFDLNKCLGCHTCTMACKTMWTDHNQGQEYMYWNNVETQPGRGYPKNWEKLRGGFAACGTQVRIDSPLPTIEGSYGAAWEYNYGEVLKTDGTPPTAPMVVPTPDPSGPDAYASNWDEDVGAGTFPNSYYFYLPRICNHCSNPACLSACTRKAIYKREEDGIVLIDQDRCRGYRHCIQACPYKKVYWNPTEKVSQKCIFCYPRLENRDPVTGQPDPLGNFCVTQCTGRIRWVCYYDPNKGPTHPDNLRYNGNRLVDEFGVALRLHPEFGTEPNTYYIPPLSPNARIPLGVLAKMFGDTCAQTPLERVQRVRAILARIQAARAGSDPELARLLIARAESDRIQLGP